MAFGDARTLVLGFAALAGSVAVYALVHVGRLIRRNERLRVSAQRSSRLLSATLDSAGDGFLVIEGGGRVAACNARFVELWGVPEHVRASRDGRQLLAFLADRLVDPAAIDAARELAPWPAGERVDLLELADGRTFERRARTHPRTGRVWNVRDVTESLRAEDVLRAREEQLRQAEKLDAIGQLTSGLTHDFNNLLTAISGYSDILSQQLETSPLRHEVGEISRAADRAAALTRQLLVFSRRQSVQPRVLDLNGVVADMDKLLRRLIGEDVQLVALPTRGLAPVTGDPGQLEHAIVTLAVNARDAMPQGGTLTIATSNVELTEHETLPRGSYVALTVAHTGERTGIGVEAARTVVEQSGGAIEIESSPGVGTTFRILLPAAARARPVRPSIAAPAGLEGTETLLLVEDEAMVRDLVRRLLEGYGYTVLEARNGAEALEVAGVHEAPIELVLTDVVMPQMSGPELAEQLCKRRQGLRVIFMSGYTEEKLDPQGVLEPHVQFLAKPFTPDALARKVRDVLDGSPGRDSVAPLRKAS